MNKFLLLLTICLIGQSQSKKFLLRKGMNGDLHPKHRHLSEEGSLSLKIGGRGYFIYRLRVQTTDSSTDPSQQAESSYDGAYHGTENCFPPASGLKIAAEDAKSNCGNTGSTVKCELRDSSIAAAAHSLTSGGTSTGGVLAVGNAPHGALAVGDTLTMAECTANTNNGDYLVSAKSSGEPLTITIKNLDGTAVSGFSTTGCKISRAVGPKCVLSPVSNSGADVGSGTLAPEKVAIPNGSTVNGNELDSEDKFSQTVYSRDGSMHVNRFGYLVDDNGLLLVGSTTRTNDANAIYHIHIPSRAEGIVVTPTGKVMAEELGGSKYSKVGQIKLARFENPQGLNIRIKMKSNCVAADEDGFALGNWCAGGKLDGKDHTYYAESIVSGPGILGEPGEQGFGRILI